MHDAMVDQPSIAELKQALRQRGVAIPPAGVLDAETRRQQLEELLAAAAAAAAAAQQQQQQERVNDEAAARVSNEDEQALRDARRSTEPLRAPFSSRHTAAVTRSEIPRRGA